MMLCPTCARTLHTVERQGIEIEHCGNCGGLWLDAGELDRLVRQEAMLALSAGQQALRLARNNREYDATADDSALPFTAPANSQFGTATSGDDILPGASSVLRRAASRVATGTTTVRQRSRIVV